MPRIKDLKDQQLYRIDKNLNIGDLASLLNKSSDIDIVVEQWDQMLRVAASLKKRLTPANVIIERLINGSPSDRLSRAFTHLGRWFCRIKEIKLIKVAIYDRTHQIIPSCKKQILPYHSLMRQNPLYDRGWNSAINLTT